jgi:transcriptional regulator with XRE-family HTH domain
MFSKINVLGGFVVDNEIGRRLKGIRTALKISQRQLARQSGVANATISQIEAGKLNPTVSMLKRVLDGLWRRV